MSLKPDAKAPTVWSIGGSDSCGGGGIQADLKTITALGAHTCTVVTAITAQNSFEVTGIQPCHPEMIELQLRTLQKDFPPYAIKTGMLAHGQNVQILANYLKEHPTQIVCDPVLLSSSGTALIDQEGLRLLREKIFPLVTVLTPNILEAETLVGYPLKSARDYERAGEDLMSMGVNSVLIKGGHSTGPICQDYWASPTGSAWLSLERQNLSRNPRGQVRGTGCTLASAIATAIAFGFDGLDAAVIGKAYVSQALDTPILPSILGHAWPVSEKYFPRLSRLCSESSEKPCAMPQAFASCGPKPLGFYPILDRSDWLKRLLPLGVSTAQLRIKDLNGYALEREIQNAVQLAKTYNCRLFINDYVDLALKAGAYGVHLGQEDLDLISHSEAILKKLLESGLRLGISTHSYAEIARAHALRPSYIAIGPIFPTTLKIMRFSPQGIQAFRTWRNLVNYPLVAIGGITLETANTLIQAGANGIAAVSDITKNADPESRTQEWLNLTGF